MITEKDAIKFESRQIKKCCEIARNLIEKYGHISIDDIDTLQHDQSYYEHMEDPKRLRVINGSNDFEKEELVEVWREMFWDIIDVGKELSSRMDSCMFIAMMASGDEENAVKGF